MKGGLLLLVLATVVGSANDSKHGSIAIGSDGSTAAAHGSVAKAPQDCTNLGLYGHLGKISNLVLPGGCNLPGGGSGTCQATEVRPWSKCVKDGECIRKHSRCQTENQEAGTCVPEMTLKGPLTCNKELTDSEKAFLTAAHSFENEALPENAGERGINVRDDYCRGALYYAAGHDKLPRVQKLLEEKANVNVADVTGTTALMVAAKRCTKDIEI